MYAPPHYAAEGAASVLLLCCCAVKGLLRKTSAARAGASETWQHSTTRRIGRQPFRPLQASVSLLSAPHMYRT